MRRRDRGARGERGAARTGVPFRKSLLIRLLAVSALVAACSVAATAWLAVQTTSGAIREQQGQNLTDDTAIYHALRGHAATRPQWDGVQRTVRELARTHDRRIALTTRDGRLIADSAATGTPGTAEGGDGKGTGGPPPGLPGTASAEVDPLTSDSAFLPGGLDGAPAATDRIDPRAVGPFALPEKERAELRVIARRITTCLGDRGIASDIVATPSGRPRLQLVGTEQAAVDGFPCAFDALDRPTRTEAKALAALTKLSDACLRRRGEDGVRLGLGMTWKSPTNPVDLGDGAPEKSRMLTPRAAAPTSAPQDPVVDARSRVEIGVFDYRLPAEFAREDRARDRAIASCVETARREQLASHVSPPALLFIGDTDGATVPGFDLSPANTARIAWVAAGVLALTIGATLLTAGRLVRPLRALTGAAQRMKDGERTEPVPVGGDNEVGRLAAAFNDMAAHRARLEAQRRDMVSDVAHELRTPLSNIRGWLEGAQDGVAEPDAAFVDSLLEEAIQLQHIIDDLRDLAEADAGALRIAPEPVRVPELLAQVAGAHQARADAAGVALRVDVPDGPDGSDGLDALDGLAAPDGPDGPDGLDVLPTVDADPVRLRQAVGNLVSNAVRHTPSGGTVTLRASVRGERLAVEVADTGQGIAAEDLAHVFDRFWRADRSRSRRTGGSGLGLAIVRKLMEAHGGEVTATSEPGRGSVFAVLLPLRREGGAGGGADRGIRTGPGAAGSAKG
ncbi:HAMP domain-containing sensor histidine kinase [Streptomyces sp. NPDC000594]|uniref:sensor histidine kinase n=1 Tax=Streptomyces sp. NPDC000594 TaxID=3154261 RepID=UPI00332CB1C1